MLLPRTFIAAAMILSLCVAPRSGEAWGRQGHRIVARIAAKNLSADARQRVRAVLGVSDAGLESAMAAAAIWPDLIDKRRTGTSNWHFVDVAIGSPFSLAGLCAAHDCVIDQIEQMRSRLQTNQQGFTLLQPPVPSRPASSQVLAFLIHFVGDIHQPLHASANGDRGGNCVTLTNALTRADGSMPTADLHTAWDVDQVLAVMRSHGNREASTAAALFQKFKNGTTIAQRSPIDWARESHELARARIYQKLAIPVHSAPPGQCATGIQKVTVTASYLAGNVAATEERLLQAGIRLSNVLNATCKGTGCQAIP